jgi:hypothetical protein
VTFDAASAAAQTIVVVPGGNARTADAGKGGRCVDIVINEL